MNKQDIRDLFKTHGITVTKDDVWEVQGTPVIRHAALERLSAKLGLTWDMPKEVIISMTEVVILARASRKDGISEWSYGEVNVVRDGVSGGNYRISGKQAGYPWAMAEKRAKDRVIIKLAGLHGAYSEDESDDFRRSNATNSGDDTGTQEETSQETEQQSAPTNVVPLKGKKSEAPHDPQTGEIKPELLDLDAEMTAADAIKLKIDAFNDAKALGEYMNDRETQADLFRLGKEVREQVRDYAIKRHVQLRAAAKAAQAAAAATPGE